MLPDPKIIFIINPIAGTKSKQVILDFLGEKFPEESYEVVFTNTRDMLMKLRNRKWLKVTIILLQSGAMAP